MRSRETLQGLACLALTHFRSSEFQSLSRIVLRLSSLPDDDVRYHAVRAMGQMLQYSPKTTRQQGLTTLYQKTFDRAHHVRGEALMGLVEAPRVLATEIGPDAFARMLGMQADPHPCVRARVAVAVWRVFSQVDSSERLAAQETLGGLADDVNIWVGKEAQRSLRFLKKRRTTHTEA